MTPEEELEEFRRWKKIKNRNALDVAFEQLELTLNNPAGRQFNAIMSSLAYRTLANAIIALKNEVVK